MKNFINKWVNEIKCFNNLNEQTFEKIQQNLYKFWFRYFFSYSEKISYLY